MLPSEAAMGWPLGGVCPSCYGDAAFCGECGAVLPAALQVEVCAACEAAWHNSPKPGRVVVVVYEGDEPPLQFVARRRR